MQSRIRGVLIYPAVGLTAAAVLVLELGLTRLFSVVFYYHFAFLAISIALFGLGAGGVLSYWVGRTGKLEPGKLGWLSLFSGALVFAALWALLKPGGEPSTGDLVLVYFACAAPFAALGAVLSLAIAGAIDRIDRVYFADLTGAAAGCLMLVPLLNGLGGPNTILSVPVLLALAAALWFALSGVRMKAAAAVVFSLAGAGLVAWNANSHAIDLKSAKGVALTHEIYVKWNSFSRISARQEPGWGTPAIIIDADANTEVAGDNIWDWVPEAQRQHLLRQEVHALAYLVRPRAKTLIIGSGGGMDVVNAIASGSKDITAVEINPIIANDLMRGRFAGVSRGLYFRPEVRVAVEDGRAYVRRSPERYQIIQATLVDTWASTAAGAFSLSESNLYTVEAFTDYLDHLTRDGLLAFTRWGFDPPRESLRLVTLAAAALERLGEVNPARHIAVIREGSAEQVAGLGGKDAVLVARKAWTAEDLATLRALCSNGRWRLAWLPGENIPGAFQDLLTSRDRAQWLSAYRYDVSPVTDDRPFFFYTVQPRDLRAFLAASDSNADFKINKAVPTLYALVGVSLLATLLTLLLPPLVLRARLPRKPGVLVFLLYFAAIGTGYILIEVALIQKFVLFLGQPTYSLTVIVFAILASSGLGSYASRRWSPRFLWIAAAAAALALLLRPLLGAAVSMPLPAKIAASAVLVAPLGFLMGMPFPWGLRLLESWHGPAVRWAWSLNAASSVMGSALAIFLGLYLGLTTTLLLGASLYLGAWGLARFGSRHAV